MVQRMETTDPFAKRLIAHYLGRRASDVEALRDALGAGEFDAIRVTGHNMFGSGEAYGLKRISEIGRDIEAAAEQRDGTTVAAHIDALEAYLRELTIS
ncbi:MAG: hypothetical protein AAF290_07215 [Pseudomonadota bacterium]